MKKITLLLSTLLVFSGISVPAVSVSASEITQNENSATVAETLDITSESVVLTDGILNADLSTASASEQKQVEVADQLSNYFELDEEGNPVFTADYEVLTNDLGLSDEEANSILQTATETEDSNVLQKSVRGFCGLYINLGSKVRKMGAWSAGAYVGGYVGWYLKQFATTPHGAGIVALISGGIVFAVKMA